MQKLVLSLIAAAFIFKSTTAQTLFTYGKDPVSKQEFLKNYEKNTLNKQPDLSEKALREYLDLYALFKMKVKEAELQQLDTMPAIQTELQSYRKQLAKNYLTDKQVDEKLMKEAYERMKNDRHVMHILISIPPNMTPQDTFVRYKKADSIYTALTKGKADFATLAKLYSDDRGSKENGGDIGYITALQTLYPFENAVYNTPVGKISKPFRTPLGYHIVKVVDERPARGEVEVAQILFSTPESKGPDGVKDAQKNAEKVYKELKSGKNFDDMVKQYSDDRYTKNDNGKMQRFGVGRMVPAFEDAAFALKNPGDYSAPVQTQYGFHIIQLIKKYPLESFDSMRSTLKRKVENDSREQIAKDAFFEKIKEKNGFKENAASLDELIAKVQKLPDTGRMAGAFSAKDFASMDKTLFTLGKNSYSQYDFMSYAEMMTRGRIMGNREKNMKDIYKMYVDKVVDDFQEHKLEDENPEFKNLMTEYRDGIMLFELMDRNVWTKASKDTAGLEKFYEANKAKYQWEPGFSGTVYRFKNEEDFKKGMKLLEGKSKISNEDIAKAMNTESNPEAVVIQTGRFEYSKFNEVPKAEIKKGSLSQPIKNADGSYTVLKTDDTYSTSTQKSLKDAKGYVVAEYQDYLEKKWNADLKTKYPLKVDETVFMSMVK